jgi:hypothetical protein
MAKGIKTGGRSAGTPNRNTVEVKQTLEALGCDPIEGMARLATDERVEISIRFQAYKELAQYIYPKRKAIEHGGETGGHAPPVFVIDIGPPPANGTDSV